jgi:hypothetical protein
MQRGPLLQPLRSTENILSGPPRARKLAGLSTGRLTAARTASASSASFFSHLSRSTEEANPSSGRVFLSAFAPQKPHSFPMGKPRFAPLPPRRIRLTPFPQSCHGFVLAPSSRQKPRQPRVSTNLLLWVGVTPPAQGSLVLANFAPEASPFSKSAKMPDLREPRTGSAPINSRFLAGGIS